MKNGKPWTEPSQNVSVPRRLLWVGTFNQGNAFETLASYLSALALQIGRNETATTWEILGAYRRLPANGRAGTHVANLTRQFRSHLWRGGAPLATHEARTDGVVRCYDGADEVNSLDAFASFGPAGSMAVGEPAPRRLWLVPRAAAGPADGRRRRACCSGGRRRDILNVDGVLATLKSAGFLPLVFGVEDSELASMLAMLRSCSLLVTVHGAGMVNQLFLRPNRAAVIEAFPPGMLYGTGFSLSNLGGFLHLPLLMRWPMADLTPLTDAARFRASPFRIWHEVKKSGWGPADVLAHHRQHCDGRRPPSLFVADMNDKCLLIAKQVNYTLPLEWLEVLALRAAAWFDAPASGVKPWVSRAHGCELGVEMDAGVRVLPHSERRLLGAGWHREQVPLQRAAAVPATGSAMRGVLSLLGYCPRVAGGGGPVAVCVRLRDGKRRAWVARAAAAGAGGAAPVLVDVVTPEAVRPTGRGGGGGAAGVGGVPRVHLHYFCGGVPGENATAAAARCPPRSWWACCGSRSRTRCRTRRRRRLRRRSRSSTRGRT